jgi:hypothetical protein
MPAPRKYGQRQREAIYRLSLEGLPSHAISERCAAGIEGTPGFEIPPRTVRSIVHQERQRRPTSDPCQDSPKHDPRASVLHRLDQLERWQHEGYPEPGPLSNRDRHPCDVWRCNEWAVELRRASRREAVPGARRFLCADHLEEAVEAGRVEPVPEPTMQPIEEAAEETAAATTSGSNESNTLQAPKSQAQARTAPEPSGGIEDGPHAQAGYPRPHESQAAGSLTPAQKQELLEQLDAKLDARPQPANRAPVIGMRRTDNTRG